MYCSRSCYRRSISVVYVNGGAIDSVIGDDSLESVRLAFDGKSDGSETFLFTVACRLIEGEGVCVC